MQNVYGSQVIKVCGRHSYLEKRNGLVTVTRTKIKVRDDIKKSWNLAEKGVIPVLEVKYQKYLTKTTGGTFVFFAPSFSVKKICVQKNQEASINSKNAKIIVFDLF